MNDSPDEPPAELETWECLEVAQAHDLDLWNTQREGMERLRDASAEIAEILGSRMQQLLAHWSGSTSREFSAEVDELTTLLEQLRDSAASNAAGMGEIAGVAETSAEKASHSDQEDLLWSQNSNEDSESFVDSARADVRSEAMRTLQESGQTYQSIAAEHLAPPPPPPRLLQAEASSSSENGEAARVPATSPQPGADSDAAAASPPSAPSSMNEGAALRESEMEEPPAAESSAGASVAEEQRQNVSNESEHPARGRAEVSAPELGADSAASGGPQLQSAAHTAAPAEAQVRPTAVAADAPPPAGGGGGGMPMSPGGMGGGGAGGAGGSGGAAPRPAGVVYGEQRLTHGSSLRSQASRQDQANRAEGLYMSRGDVDGERRAVHVDPDSPFAPSDNTVAPAVISGAAPVGPHDAGPVITGGGIPEPEPIDDADWEDVDVDPELDAEDPEVEPQPHPQPEPDGKSEAVRQAEAAEEAAEKSLFTTMLSGKEYISALQSLPPEKMGEFIAAQRALRTEPDPEESKPASK